MIRTSPFAKLVSAVLFAAVCAYALAYFARLIEDGRKVVLTEMTAADSIALEGIALRSEQPVCPEGEPVFFCESGERAAAGQVVAERNGERIVADESAIFFKDCDGYEYLSVTEEAFSPELLEKLLCAEKHDTAAGRLVKGRTWYFAAVADAEIVDCGEVKIKLENSDEKINASVVRAFPNGRGKTAALLKIRIGKNEFLSLRRCRGEIILKEVTGLAVPTNAVIEEGGKTFVNKCTLTGEIPCPVDIIYRSEDFFIISPTDELYPGAKVKMHNA